MGNLDEDRKKSDTDVKSKETQNPEQRHCRGQREGRCTKRSRISEKRRQTSRRGSIAQPPKGEGEEDEEDRTQSKALQKKQVRSQETQHERNKPNKMENKTELAGIPKHGPPAKSGFLGVG